VALKKEPDSAENSDLCKLTIDEDMTIYVIDDLKKQLAEEFHIYNPFELDLSGVEEFDSAGVQFLLAMRGELLRTQKEFKLIALSNVVGTMLKNYGIADSFNLESIT